MGYINFSHLRVPFISDIAFIIFTTRALSLSPYEAILFAVHRLCLLHRRHLYFPFRSGSQFLILCPLRSTSYFLLILPHHPLCSTNSTLNLLIPSFPLLYSTLYPVIPIHYLSFHFALSSSSLLFHFIHFPAASTSHLILSHLFHLTLPHQLLSHHARYPSTSHYPLHTYPTLNYPAHPSQVTSS